MRNVAKAVIEKDDKFLLVKRSNTPRFPNIWEFPGGRCEEEESPEKAAKREVMEETSLSVEIGELIDDFVLIFSNTEYHFHIFRAHYVKGEVVLSEEHSDFRWLTQEEALNLDIKDYTGDFLRKTSID